MGKKGGGDKKGKKVRKKQAKPRKGEHYKIEGGKAQKTKMECPKCGAGVFMAEHKDRQHCGRCGYTKWKK
ncbi:MAG: 30S ribosomal protein S27ae [Candidatus Diapherotrites archaeon]|nr:30S ribosomal protein S27ae [Candidatus Diapherotrites archaeon]